IDGAGDLVEPELERIVRDRELGKDLGSEDTRMQPPKSSHRAEATALSLGNVYCGAEARPDPELIGGEAKGRVSRDERHRLRRDTSEAALELRDRLALRQATDIHPVDSRPVRELASSTREREPHKYGGERDGAGGREQQDKRSPGSMRSGQRRVERRVGPHRTGILPASISRRRRSQPLLEDVRAPHEHRGATSATPPT